MTTTQILTAYDTFRKSKAAQSSMTTTRYFELTTPTELEVQWREEAQKVWDEQGRAHWVNLSDFDNYTAGYIRARTEQAYELLAEGKIFEAKELLEKRVNNPVFIGK